MLEDLQAERNRQQPEFSGTSEFKQEFFRRAAEADRQKKIRFIRIVPLAAAAMAAVVILPMMWFSHSGDRGKTVPVAKNGNAEQVIDKAVSQAVPATAAEDTSSDGYTATASPVVSKTAGVSRFAVGAGAFNAPGLQRKSLRSVPKRKALIPENFNTEEYSSYSENPFFNVSDQPLSTFGADIDTASYTNVRRMIMNNKLPQRDAVRIEEFINFFTYDYKPVKANGKFDVSFESIPAPWNSKHRLLLIGVQAESIDLEDLPPANYVFLLDNSGSMYDQMPLVKEAMQTLLGKLRKGDRISLVTYGGSVKVLLDGIAFEDRAKAEEIIKKLSAGGFTSGGEGIQTAYKLAHKHFIKGGNNRIVMMTDGDFNVGVSSEAELVKMVEKERSSGIYLSVFGTGVGNYKENKLKNLANKGNGNCFYVDNLREARQAISSCFAGKMFTIAKDVKFQIEFNPRRVAGYRLLGYESRKLAARDFNDDSKDSGEVGVGSQVTALYEIVPAGEENPQIGGKVDALKYQTRHANDSKEILTFKLRYQAPEGGKPSELKTFVLKEFPEGSNNIKWASAVAEFAMLLRNSPHKGNASYQAVLDRARAALGKDPEGKRAEFLVLVRNAGELSGK